MEGEKFFKDENIGIKIPVLSYFSADKGYLNNMILQENLSDFVENGDIFDIYKKISSYLKNIVV